MGWKFNCGIKIFLNFLMDWRSILTKPKKTPWSLKLGNTIRGPQRYFYSTQNIFLHHYNCWWAGAISKKIKSPKALVPYLFEETYSVLYNPNGTIRQAWSSWRLETKCNCRTGFTGPKQFNGCKGCKNLMWWMNLKKLKKNNTATERQIPLFLQEFFSLSSQHMLENSITFSFEVSSCARYILHVTWNIVSEPKTAETRMSNLSMALLEKKQISEICAEKSRKQFG